MEKSLSDQAGRKSMEQNGAVTVAKVSGLFEAIALSFEVFCHFQELAFAFVRALSVIFSSSPFLPKCRKLEQEDDHATMRNRLKISPGGERKQTY